jgi:DNA-binding SARP family transcriptional activator/tetratricopeptide (TPR) repeat protein
MRFHVLGPLAVRGDDGGLLVANRRKQRALLGLLLLRANTTVANESIVDALWGERPPASAAANLQSYVADLRRLLRAGQPARESRLRTRRGGYRLLVEAGELDAEVFQRLAAEGRDALAGGDAAVASERLVRALGEWQGYVLEGLDLPALEPERARLEELRLAVLEDSIEARLRLGAHRELPAELAALVCRYPLRERMWGQLMLALYRCGRQGDALAAFRRAAEHLAEELGLAPGEPLRRLHARILAADPALDGPAQATGPDVAAATAAAVPAQLPADVGAFSGRVAELSELDTLLAAAGQPGAGRGDAAATAVVISAVSGTAGVGKTALAVHWAHRVADRFPDGQLYVNLRGFDPGGQIVDPAAAVRGFLDALGISAQRIPAGVDAQAALYRTVLAGKRVLVVVDNARDAEHARPLLPGSRAAFAVVTSRNQLTNLVAADGAHPLTLDLLTEAEARELLARRLGPGRVANEPVAVEEIIGACARLPLALAVVAARAATHPSFGLAALAVELSDTSGRAGRLDAGDVLEQVRAVFSWSYTALTPSAAQLFRLLGLHPGPDISTAAAASLAAAPPAQTRPLLAELTRAGLLTEHASGRYGFHDLLAAYATDLTHATDTDAERRAATTRLLDHYTHTAHTADQHLDPAGDPVPVPLTPPAPGTTPEQLTDQQALGWLDAERPVLLAVQLLAAGTGRDAHAWQLAWALDTVLTRRGYWHELGGVWQAALPAAARLPHPAAATAHRFLGWTVARLGDDEQADTHLQHALRLDTEAADPVDQAYTHHALGFVWGRRGRPDRALDHIQQALTLYQATGHRRGQANALNNVGWYHALLGDHTRALTYCQQALTLHQQLGDREAEAATWDSLGYTHHHLNHHAQAADCYHHALALARDLGDRYNEATILSHLGDTHHAAGQPDQARTTWTTALEILTDLDHADADTVRAKLTGLDQPSTPPGQPPAGPPR